MTKATLFMYWSRPPLVLLAKGCFDSPSRVHFFQKPASWGVKLVNGWNRSLTLSCLFVILKMNVDDCRLYIRGSESRRDIS